MKTSKNHMFGILVFCVLLTLNAFAQERPAYITVTTTHYNFEHEDGTPEEWLALEKEFHEKVTMKNELIMAAQFLNHFYTADNSEVVLVSAYSSWENIEKAQDRSQELIEAGWPDEKARDAYFKKRDAYYLDKHTDEIYAVLPNVKLPVLDSTNKDKAMVYYVQKHHTASPDDGDDAEIEKLHQEFIDNIILKNKYLKGFFEYRHAWGSDNLEYIQVRVFDSLSDLEAGGAETGKLVNGHWPDEAARKAYFERYNKYYTGWHGDFLYRNVPSLRK